MASPTLSLNISMQQSDFTLDCAFDSRERVTGLFGPSGAGKSSLLRVIAGLARPDAGQVHIAGRCVFDAKRCIDLPAHKRRIGYVFQQALLLPHLNVRRNLGYGGWFAARRPSRQRFDRVVEMLDIGPLLTRRVSGLSGGEAQRVAIGRALLADPALLLLDEPLASLDAPRKREVLPYLERLSEDSGLPVVFVSHQLDELLRLANRHVVVLRAGGVAFSGATSDFLARADLLGDHGAREAGVLLAARIAAHEDSHGLSVLDCGGQALRVPRLAQSAGAAVTVHVRARDVILATAAPSGTSALNVLHGQIRHIDTLDEYAVDVVLDIDGQRLDARITRRSADSLALATGQRVHAVIKSLALAEQAWERLGGL